MIPSRINITKHHAETWDRHWSPSTMGHNTPGRVFGAMASGMSIDFMNEMFTDISAAPLVLSKVIPASLAVSLAAPLSYHILTHSLFLTAGSTGAGGVPATTGIVPSTALNARAKGLLAMVLADVDAESMITLQQNNLNWLAMNVNQAWEVTYRIAAVVNGDIATASGGAEFGVCLDGAAADPANPMGTRFMHFAISANRISLTDEIGVIASAALPVGQPFDLTLTYDPARHAIYGWVDGRVVGHRQCNAAFTSAGIAARVFHTAAYLALNDAPMAVFVDGIVAHNLPQLG